MQPDAEGWVTSRKVIDTIIALDGLLPGDELRLNRRCGDIDLPECCGTQVTVRNGGGRDGERGEPYGRNTKGRYIRHHIVCTTECDAVLTRHVIAAWRRPHGR